MKIIRRMIRSLLSWAHEDNSNTEPAEAPSIGKGIYIGNIKNAPHPRDVASPPFDMHSHRGLTFTIFSANGGKVIQTQCYDARNDRLTYNLYVIGIEDNMGEELEQIISVESLSR